MPVPNTFANATTSIPLSQLDANFATAITLGNTAIQLGNTVSTLNNMTLANVTVSSGTVTVANVTVTGVGTFAAGSNTAPSITTAGDTNTGFFFPAADTVGITTGGSERMRVDSSGNIGIGTTSPVSKLNVSGVVTSSDGTAGGGAFALGTSANGVLSATSTTLLTLNGAGYTNVSINGNVGIGTTSPQYVLDIFNSSTATDYVAGRFRSTAAASGETRTWLNIEKSSSYGGAIGGYLSQGVGSGLLFGTLNASVTPTERMRIDSSGNVGIGTSSPTAKLHVVGTVQSTSGSTAAQIYSDGGAAYFASAGAFPALFLTNSAERMRIDSSGNVGIGTSSPKNTLDVSGSITLDQNYQTYLVNSYYDGAWKYIGNGFAWGIGNNFGGVTNGTTIAVASVNAGGAGAGITWNPAVNIDSSGNLLVGTTNASATAGEGTKILDAGRLIGTVASYSTSSNSSLLMYSTGAGAYRFYVTWAGAINATSTSITGISDARLKENVVTIKDGLNTVTKLNPVTYNFKNMSVCDDGKIQHYGFLAQEVQSLMPTLVAEGLNETEDGSKYLTLKMGDMIPVLVAAIKELKAEIDLLKGNP